MPRCGSTFRPCSSPVDRWRQARRSWWMGWPGAHRLDHGDLRVRLIGRGRQGADRRRALCVPYLWFVLRDVHRELDELPRRAEVNLTMADIDAVSRRVPCLAKVSPSSDYHMEDV